MKLCSQCGKSPLPFVMVIFVSGVSAFVTWLTLSYSQFEEMQVIVGSGIVFLAVAATVLHYVLSCIRRHCRHGSHGSHGERHQHPGAVH